MILIIYYKRSMLEDEEEGGRQVGDCHRHNSVNS